MSTLNFLGKKVQGNWFANAEKTLLKSPIEDGVYLDSKYVREACGITYLAFLLAIDSYLLSKSTLSKELPSSTEHYWKIIPKIPHKGKLDRIFTVVYQNLHLFGYYRGAIDVEMIKSGMMKAKEIIDMLKK